MVNVMGKKLVYGVGINDASYTVQPLVNGKQVECKYYRAWKCMLMRCYSKVFQNKNPTYVGCSVCDDWLIFSNFRKWLEGNNWNGEQIDKDILFEGNTIYGPEFCCFVDNLTNCFFLDRGACRGECMIGAYKRLKDGKFIARCRNPFTGRGEHLGSFEIEVDAHLAWKRRKHELALQISKMQKDDRVARVLLKKYAP